MAYKYSTELRRQLAVVGSMKEVLDGGVLRFYGGPVPASADSALSGNTLLLEVKTNVGGNLTFDSNADGAVFKKSLAEIWTGDGVAAGNMTFCRYEKPGDTGGAGTGEVRVQGSVGGPAADITVSSTLIEVGETRTMEYFAIEILEYV